MHEARPVHTIVGDTFVCMQVDRLSVTDGSRTRPSGPGRRGAIGISVSRWLSQAASDHLRNELLGAALEVWEAEQGPFTDDELDAAARVLGVSGSNSRRAG